MLLQVESAFLFDSVFLFNDALEALYARNGNSGRRQLAIQPEPLSCSDTNRYHSYQAGHNITSLMREVSVTLLF